MSTDEPSHLVLVKRRADVGKRHKLGAGRKPGSKNRASIGAKANIDAVFVQMGGVPGMLRWAKKNQTDFYTKVYPKMIALQVVGAGPNGEHLITPVLNVSLSDDA